MEGGREWLLQAHRREVTGTQGGSDREREVVQAAESTGEEEHFPQKNEPPKRAGCEAPPPQRDCWRPAPKGRKAGSGHVERTTKPW